jgi:hypothetical protein
MRYVVGVVMLVLLAGCGPGLLFTDDTRLAIYGSLGGRWVSENGKERVELQITSGGGQGCALLQIVGESETYRLCSLNTAGAYQTLVAHELQDEALPGPERRYYVWHLKWLGEHRIGAVQMDAAEAVKRLDLHATPVLDKSCAEKPVEEQPKCADYRVDPDTLPQATPERLAAIYSALIQTPDDEIIFTRIQPDPKTR